MPVSRFASQSCRTILPEGFLQHLKLSSFFTQASLLDLQFFQVGLLEPFLVREKGSGQLQEWLGKPKLGCNLLNGPGRCGLRDIDVGGHARKAS